MTRRPFYIDVPDDVPDAEIKLLLRDALAVYSGALVPDLLLVDRHLKRCTWVPAMLESLRDRRTANMAAAIRRETDKIEEDLGAVPPLEGTRLIPTFDAAGENPPGFVAVDSKPAKRVPPKPAGVTDEDWNRKLARRGDCPRCAVYTAWDSAGIKDPTNNDFAGLPAHKGCAVAREEAS